MWFDVLQCIRVFSRLMRFCVVLKFGAILCGVEFSGRGDGHWGFVRFCVAAKVQAGVTALVFSREQMLLGQCSRNDLARPLTYLPRSSGQTRRPLPTTAASDAEEELN